MNSPHPNASICNLEGDIWCLAIFSVIVQWSAAQILLAYWKDSLKQWRSSVVPYNTRDSLVGIVWLNVNIWGVNRNSVNTFLLHVVRWHCSTYRSSIRSTHLARIRSSTEVPSTHHSGTNGAIVNIKTVTDWSADNFHFCVHQHCGGFLCKKNTKSKNVTYYPSHKQL